MNPETLKSLLTWPVVVLLLGAVIAFALTAIFAPPDVREWIFGANGIIVALIALFMRSPLDREATERTREPSAGKDRRRP